MWTSLLRVINLIQGGYIQNKDGGAPSEMSFCGGGTKKVTDCTTPPTKDTFRVVLCINKG